MTNQESAPANDRKKSSKSELHGSLLQTTSSIAGISIALYAALYAFNLNTEGIEIPKVILGGLGLSGNLAIVASISFLNTLVRTQDKQILETYFGFDKYAYIFWSFIVLWLVYLMLVVPGIPRWISEIFQGNLP